MPYLPRVSHVSPQIPKMAICVAHTRRLYTKVWPQHKFHCKWFKNKTVLCILHNLPLLQKPYLFFSLTDTFKICSNVTLLKGVHNGRTMLSYIQEHIVCSWKQFESAWKSIWVLRYCKKYDVLFCFFGHLSVSQFQFLKLGHDPWSIVTK